MRLNTFLPQLSSRETGWDAAQRSKQNCDFQERRSEKHFPLQKKVEGNRLLVPNSVSRANENPNCLHYYEKYVFQKGHRFIRSIDKHCNQSSDILWRLQSMALCKVRTSLDHSKAGNQQFEFSSDRGCI